MALGNFHVGGGLWQILSDGADENTDLDYVGLAGLTMTFTSNIPITKTVAVEGGLLIVPQRTVVVQSDGTFKERLPSGELAATAGIDLLANDPELELEDDGQVQWTVTSNSILVGSQMVKLQPWTFDAPAPGWSGTIDELAPVLSVSVTQIIKGDSAYQIAVNNGFEGTQEEWLDSLHSWDDLIGSPAVIAAGDTEADARDAIGAEDAAMKGEPDGYAPLDESGLIDAAYLPSYVDDVLSFENLAAFPGTGATGKIYIAEDTGDSYRWSGSAYVRISDRVTASGITDSTTVGRAVVTAATAATARAALELGNGYGGVNVKHYGALGDGSTDDTTAIHAARDAAGAGGTVIIPPGTYITTGLTLSTASQVWQIMPGAVIKCKSSGYGAQTVNVTAANVTLTGGGVVDGNRAALGDSAAGVVAVVTGAVAASDLLVENITIRNSTYFGVWGQGLRTRVLRCTFTGNCAVDILLSSYYLAVILGSTMQDTYDMEASYNFCDRSGENPATTMFASIQIRGNADPEGALHKTYRPRALFNTIVMPASPAEETGRVTGIEFSRARYGIAHGNRIINGSMGISFAVADYCQAINNSIFGPTLFGIELADSPGSVVQGNVIDGNGVLGSLPDGSGITGNGSGLSNDVSVVGNRIFNMHSSGRPIRVGYVARWTVAGNVIEQRYGVTLTSLADSVVSSNVMLGDGIGQGVALANCSSVSVIGNMIRNHAKAVYVYASSGTSDYLNITGNHFRQCAAAVDGVTAGGTIGTNIINANNLVRA